MRIRHSGGTAQTDIGDLGVGSTGPVGSPQATFGPSEWGLFVAISLIWGSSFLLIAEGLESLTPGMVTLARVGTGAMTLLLLRLRSGPSGVPIQAADRPRILLLAIVWVVVPFTLFPLAQEHINSALTGLLNGATPVFVALVALALTGTWPRGGLLFGLALGFVGVVTLSLPSLNEGTSEAKGVLMVLAATVCYGVAMNLASPLQRRYGAVTLMTPILVVATLMLLPLGLRHWGDNVWQTDSLISVLVLGVGGTGIAYWIMATLVGRVGAVRASFITYLIPVVSLILGVIVRGDSVAPLALIGAAMTTAGALVASGQVRLAFAKNGTTRE